MSTFSVSASASQTVSSLELQSTPVQGAFDSAGAGITGGYTGDSLSLKIIIAFFIGLALYNSIELIILILVTFNKYSGLYFWALIIAGFGIMPYELGFLIKFFQLLNPNEDICFVAVVLLTLGWYMMITGQSVVLWSRLHLLTNSCRVLRWTLYMIITNAIVLHIPTTILTFGSNANRFSHGTLAHFVTGYTYMEKIQMVGFFVQEFILSVIYIKETLRLLKLSVSVQSDITSVVGEGELRQGPGRKTMYQLLAINIIIISMDITLLAVEFANLYLVETTLKGVVYSIKLKLEFAVLGKLVQVVRNKSHSSNGQSSSDRQGTSTGLELAKKESVVTAGSASGGGLMQWPSFVDPRGVSQDITHAPMRNAELEERGWEEEGQGRKRRFRAPHRDSWIDVEMDKHNIG